MFNHLQNNIYLMDKILYRTIIIIIRKNSNNNNNNEKKLLLLLQRFALYNQVHGEGSGGWGANKILNFYLNLPNKMTLY